MGARKRGRDLPRRGGAPAADVPSPPSHILVYDLLFVFFSLLYLPARMHGSHCRIGTSLDTWAGPCDGRKALLAHIC